MKTSIKFPDGSSIKWIDRETLEYSDDDRSVLIWVDFEPSLFSNERIIKASSINEWRFCPDPVGRKISDEKKAEIIDKITRYYEQYKKKYRIER